MLTCPLQRKPKVDGGTLKNSLNQEVFVLTSYVYHFSFRNNTLAKVFFLPTVFILWLTFFGQHHLKK